MDKTLHGGKREGAGRPPSVSPRKSRPLKASDQEWELIKGYAQEAGLSVNEYLVRRGLNKK